MKKVKGVAAAVLAAGMLLAFPGWAAESPAHIVQTAGGFGADIQTVALQGAPEAQKPALTEAQQQALEKFCQAVPELKELSVQHVNNEGDKTWSVMLSDRAPGAEQGIWRNAHLTFDTATGELTSYNFNNPAWTSADFMVLAEDTF